MSANNPKSKQEKWFVVPLAFGSCFAIDLKDVTFVTYE
jgi:hypothetical protein